MDLDRDLLCLDPSARFAAMRQLRAHSPVHRLGGDGGPWYIARRSGVCQALPRIEHFSGGVGAADVDPEHQALNGIPEPRHGRIRRLVQGLIGPHRIGGVRAFLGPLCSRKLDEIAKSGEPFDVMTEYVDHVPSSAITWLLGWDIADAIQLFQWTVEICERAMSMKPGNTGTLTEIHPIFAAYIDERIEARLALAKDAWPDDGLSRLLAAEVDGETLTPTAVRTNLMFLLGAGSETTRDMLGGLVFELARAPELYARMRDDRSLIANATEEALRIYSPTQFMVRGCTRATLIDGQPIAEGDTVYIGLASANRDDAHFAEPDRFDVDRANAREHRALGDGPHVCPGSTLLRLETRIAIDALLDRFESIELAEGPDFEPLGTPMFYGPKRLVLRCRST